MSDITSEITPVFVISDGDNQTTVSVAEKLNIIQSDSIVNVYMNNDLTNLHLNLGEF